ncbi:hypothetical protein OIO90_004286 [Microbotryomycetes sp. JL221]|nr:hypothetical protein OIO90_004286 [Microbotryomycetes sp. JL221]
MFAPPLASRSASTSTPTTTIASNQPQTSLAHSQHTTRRKSCTDGQDQAAGNAHDGLDLVNHTLDVSPVFVNNRPSTQGSRLRAVSFSNLRAKARRSMSPTARSFANDTATQTRSSSRPTLKALVNGNDSISSRLAPIPLPNPSPPPPPPPPLPIDDSPVPASPKTPIASSASASSTVGAQPTPQDESIESVRALDAPRPRPTQIDQRSPVPSFNGSSVSGDSSSQTRSSSRFRNSAHSSEWTPLSETGPFSQAAVGTNDSNELKQVMTLPLNDTTLSNQESLGLGIEGLTLDQSLKQTSGQSSLLPPLPGSFPLSNQILQTERLSLPRSPNAFYDASSRSPSNMDESEYLSMDDSGVEEVYTGSNRLDTINMNDVSSDEEDYAQSFRHLNVRDSVLPNLFRNDAKEQDDVDQIELLNSNRPGVLDLSDRNLDEEVTVFEDTTHLLLARCHSPRQVSMFLDRSISVIVPSLVVLDLSFCMLECLNESLRQCLNVQELDVRGNPLSRLPDWLGELTNLRMLIADETGLSLLPSTLVGCNKLHTLSIRRNLLKSLPSWLHRLRGLETLAIDGNPWHDKWFKIVEPVSKTNTVGFDRPGKKQSSTTDAPVEGGGETSFGSIQLDSIASSPRVSLNASELGALTSSPVHASPVEELDQRLTATPLSPPPLESTTTNGKKGLRGIFKRMRSGSSTAIQHRSLNPSGTNSNMSVEGDGDRKTLQRLVQQEAVKMGPSTSKRLKRMSFLSLDPVMINSTLPAKVSPVSRPMTAQEAQIGLRSFMAYLRDLDALQDKIELASVGVREPRPSTSYSEMAHQGSDSSLRRTQSSRKIGIGSNNALGSTRLNELKQEAREVTTPLTKLRDDSLKRERVIKEIVDTERTYLRGLEELCNCYLVSADQPVTSNSGRVKGSVLPVAERRAVFGNIEAIKDLSRDVVLPELLEATDQQGQDRTTMLPSSNESTAMACRVAQVFKRHAKTLNLYSAYVNNFDSALSRIQSWVVEPDRKSPLLANGVVTTTTLPGSSTTTSPVFGTPEQFANEVTASSTLSSNKRKRIKLWLKRCKLDPRHSQISLESYLLLPVQRIPRYRMLLETLAGCTPSPRASLNLLASTSDSQSATTDARLEPHPVVQEALEMIGDVATSMNERKRETEGRAALLYWQNKLTITFKSPLVQPHRTLVRSGSMYLRRVVRRVEVPADDGSMDRISILQDEGSDSHLIALLCNDLLALLADSNPSDTPSGSVTLYTVLRLDHAFASQALPASSFGSPPLLRLVLDSRAILYLSCSNVGAWVRAINTQHALNH